MRLVAILSFLLNIAYAEIIDINSLCHSFQESLSKTQILSSLKARKIKVTGSEIDLDLLIVLDNLSEQFDINGPMEFYITDLEGSQKIFKSSKDPKVIFITKNAHELLFATSWRKIQNEVCLKKSLNERFFVEYTNTIYEQFMRSLVPKKKLIQKLKAHTGLNFRTHIKAAGYKEEQEFRSEEIVTIYKQLLDIPEHVFNVMKLKTIARYRVGGSIEGVAADYNPAQQKIRLTDAATMEGKDIYGEGTIIHEFGHAYDYGAKKDLMEQFYSISWRKEQGDWVLKDNQSSKMITKYSMKSEKEDFAEHFSAFVNRPEKLKNVSLKKYRFFKDKIFKDTEYFVTAAKNAKVYVDSKISDNSPPWIDSELKKSIKIISNSDSETMIISAKVKNATDDLSGVAPLYLSFKHEKNRSYNFGIKLKPKCENKVCTLFGSKEIKLTKFGKGKYVCKQFTLKDKAGNKSYIKPKRSLFVYVNGKLGINRKKILINSSLVKIKKLSSEKYNKFEVTLPVKHRKNLRSISLAWYLPNFEEKTSHYIKEFSSKPGDLNITFEVAFLDLYPSMTAKLSSVGFTLKGSSNAGKQTTRLTLEDLPNTRVKITQAGKSNLTDVINVNAIELKAFKNTNKHGGKWNILAKVPLSHQAGEFSSMRLNFRGPKGKRFSHYFSDSKRFEGKKINNGNPEYYITIPLKKFPNKGVYILESIHITSKHKVSYHEKRKHKLDSGNAFITRAKLIERGIRKTITIKKQYLRPLD